MRDVFWGGMPLLFLALSYLKHMPRWPARLLGAVFLLQALAMVHAGSWMLAHLPAPANPEPEIFAERALHFNGALRLDSVVRYRAGDADKLLFNANGPFQRVERPDPIAVLPGAFGNPESLIRLEGWSMLELRGGVWPQALALPPLRPGERGYEIEFQQKVSPPPPGPENRRLGFFLREVRLR
jgi:hypothetical protein